MLQANHITIKYGGIIAINDVSIGINEHKITAIIGPNGAGKTSLFNCISGVFAPDEGEIIFKGNHIQGLKAYQVSELGISRTYQIINLSWKMTALENVLVGMHASLKSNFWQSMLHTKFQAEEERAAYEKALELLDFVGLKHLANERSSNLPYGEQRLLEIARSLASEPSLLLLDEPVAGMNTAEKDNFYDILDRIIGKGVTVFLVEHDMKLVMGVSDYVYVVNDGYLIAQGVPAEVQSNKEVIKAYLGGE